MTCLQSILNEQIIERIPQKLKKSASSRLEMLVNVRAHKEYLNATRGVHRFLDYCAVSYDRKKIDGALATYFLWLKVVDTELDGGDQTIGKKVIAKLHEPRVDNGTLNLNETTIQSGPLFITELMKGHADHSSYFKFVQELEQLYAAVINEKKSPSMNTYIINRRQAGQQAAKCAYILIERSLFGESKRFLKLFQELSGIGNLVDSVIDFEDDLKSDVYSFTPTRKDRLSLYFECAKDSANFLLRHPMLSVAVLRSAYEVLQNKGH